MDKLKALISTEEVSPFSASSGAKLLGEFSKKYPVSMDGLQFKHMTKENLPGESEENLKAFNKTVDSYADFNDIMLPFLSDFFVKTLEIKEKEQLPQWSSPASLIASRLLQIVFGLGAMIMIDDVMSDPKSDRPVMASMFGELSEKQKEQYLKIYALKRFADLMSIELSSVASNMTTDIAKS